MNFYNNYTKYELELLDYIETLIKSNNIFERTDNIEVGHSVRTASYAKRLAEALELDYFDVSFIYLVGLIHDIGKIGITKKVLLKDTRLNDQEYEEMKKHVVIAKEIISEEKFPHVLEIINQHHERENGSGYPNNLNAKDICLGAKILAIADSYDAMTSPRIYNKVKTKDQALKELDICSQKGLYDQYLVVEFIKEMKEGL